MAFWRKNTTNGSRSFCGNLGRKILGPEQFGLFSYAQSFGGLFTAIATLGLDGIVSGRLVKD